MTLDPEIGALLLAAALAILSGVPAVHASLRRQRRAVRECVRCGRAIVLGERTCDCDPET